ncbi:hypothetical protein WMF26_38595 [Sorangium sp. So ce185]|uniref:hypothetical protein n=1 Tax=Sorangium sp. So ce185 TaxID=3133287 RepID=UPI003F5DE7FB
MDGTSSFSSSTPRARCSGASASAPPFDADGNHIWSDGFDLYLNAGEPYVRQMAVDALGNAYIAFEEPGLTSIMKVDAAGHALWLRPLGGYASYAADLALDSAGNVATAYRVTFDGRLVYALVSKLSPAGDVLWQGWESRKRAMSRWRSTRRTRSS